jgi:hypothetical protein
MPTTAPGTASSIDSLTRTAQPPTLVVRMRALSPDHYPRVWSGIRWHTLTPLERHPPCPATRFRLLAAPDGLYAQIRCAATRVTADMNCDGDPLYLQDVVELFLWPDAVPGRPALYLEHEVSPAGHCLTLLVASDGAPRARWSPWTPWGEPGAECARQRVTVQRRRGRMCGWTAAIALPWGLFTGLGATPPHTGACWRGNITRIDHGRGVARHAAWSPPPVVNFHHLPSMGVLRFEEALPCARRRG